MNRKTFKVLTIVAVAIALIGAGFLFALGALVHQSKVAIRHALEEAVGRTVAFDRLELDFWGAPTLAVKNVTVDDDPRFAATPFLHARQLKISVRWLSLVSGRPEITGLVLEQPEIQLIRNEHGDVNILETTGPTAMSQGLPPLRLPKAGIQATDGSLYFIDRSSTPPTELRLGELSINLYRSNHDRTSVDVTGTLADEENKPFAIKGTIGPLGSAADWLQTPLDLELAVASLPRVIVSRSLALLDDEIPPYLRPTGPLEISAHLSGTIAEPRITKAKLKGSLFGAAVPNATLTADVQFPDNAAWNDAVIQAELDLEQVSLDQLKQIPWIGRILPSELVVKGPLNVHNAIAGAWESLTVRTTLNARENEIRYGRWFMKQPGVNGNLLLATRLSPQQIAINESTLQLYNGRFSLSGSITEKPERVVHLLVKTANVPLVGWENLLPFAAGYETDGKFTTELSIYKKSSPRDEAPILQGRLQLVDAHAISKKPGERNFEGLNADIRFEGEDIEIRNLQLRSGASDLALKGQLTHLRKPILYYSLQSSKLRLFDLTQRREDQKKLLHNLASEGVMEIAGGSVAVKGNFKSSDGAFNDTAYRNLRAKLDWSRGGLKFKDVSLDAFGGSVEAYGSVLADPDLGYRVRLSPTLRELDMNQVLRFVSPASVGAITGRLDLDGQFSGAGRDWQTLSATINGYGRVDLHNGVIEKFNLMRGVLASLDAIQGIRGINAAGAEFTPLMESGHTQFLRINASFRIEKGRLFSDDVAMTTPDYAITSNGWLDADGRLGWDADLALSAEFSRALSSSHRNVRYLLDDGDVMSIPFHLKGKIPRVEVKPGVAQLVRFMHAKAAEDRRKNSGRDSGAQESGLWNSFRQSSDDLWNSFRQFFR